MIQFNPEKCRGCGLCVRICHEKCMTRVDNTVHIDYAFCSTCTQCVAVCPNQALSWEGVSPVSFKKEKLPSADQFDELLKERRTTRHFKKERIDRSRLEEIVSYGIFAPTNNFHLRAVVVDDEALIREMERFMFGIGSWLYRLLFKPKFVYRILKRLRPTGELEKVRPKIECVVRRGQAFNYPAAFVFVVGDRRVSLSRDSAQYALYNMTLCAQIRGIGSFLWGNGPIFIDKSHRMRKRLELNKHEHILAAAGFGYPAVHFSNKVNGKKLGIRWIGERPEVSVPDIRYVSDI